MRGGAVESESALQTEETVGQESDGRETNGPTSVGVSSDGVIEGDGWTLDQNGVFALTKNTPDGLGGYQHEWLPYADKIREVIVADGVTKIPVGAFSNNEGGYFKDIYCNLERVSLSPSVRIIGAGAFNQVKSLKEVELNDGLEDIQASAFSGSGITSIKIPTGVTLGSDVFTYCEDLSGTVIIPVGTKWNGNAQFYGCIGLKAVVVEEGQTSIPNQMLYQCTGLEYVKLPKSLVEFGDTDLDSGFWDDPIHAPIVIGYSGTEAERYVEHWTSVDTDWAKGMTFHAIDGNDHSCETWSTVKEPTCDTAGTQEGICTICGATCTREIAALGHSWDEGVVTTEPTESTEGVRTFTCSVCGETRFETVSKLDQQAPGTGGEKTESARDALPATGDPTSMLGILMASGMATAAAGKALRRKK